MHDEIVAVSLEEVVRLLVDDEDEVGRELVGLLVALVGEGYLRTLLPSRLHVDRQYLRFSHHPPVVLCARI